MELSYAELLTTLVLSDFAMNACDVELLQLQFLQLHLNK